MVSRVIVIVLAALFAGGAPALAQTTPSAAPTAASALPTIPPNAGAVVEGIIQHLAGDATAGYGVDPNHVKGSVTYFRRYDLQIRMPLNQYKTVHLHQGTIVNPRGATIAQGNTVDVVGRANADGSIEADAITIVH
ncbi:MAG: hypothetical protein M3R51_09035 [Candidatus Eremiobacteraeota bacterium]|nr:hypothetical protein [Candidatus Eremiobacteraeota bacterium]